MADSDAPTVLIVEDDAQLREVYSHFLQASGDYCVRTAASGEDALDQLDESVDVVLLDRRMPGLDGEQTLNHIRDQGIDCPVAIVTGVDPDFDTIERDFDDYLVKPAAQDDLLDIVDSLLDHSED